MKVNHLATLVLCRIVLRSVSHKFLLPGRKFSYPGLKFHTQAWSSIPGYLILMFKKLLKISRDWFEWKNGFFLESQQSISFRIVGSRSRSGVDVMITIFCDFCQFSAICANFLRYIANFRRKNSVFLKKQCKDHFLQKLAVVRAKNVHIFVKFFGENILRITTSVPETKSLRYSLKSSRVARWVCEKNRPKYSPVHFLSKLIHSFYSRKK
jgi:hypothetical protein